MIRLLQILFILLPINALAHHQPAPLEAGLVSGEVDAAMWWILPCIVVCGLLAALWHEARNHGTDA